MTSLCNANFELDDANEVQEICRRTKPRTASGGVGEEAVAGKDHAELGLNTTKRPFIHGRTTGVNYRSSPIPRNRSEIPNEITNLPSTLLPHAATPDNEDKPRRPSTPDPHTVEGTKLIKPHEKAEPWDDHPRYDLTYHNPNYFQPIENILWLPVNPQAILDSDDTLDLLKAITSEPGGGALGQWSNEIATVLHDTPRSSLESVDLCEEDDYTDGPPPLADAHTSADLRRRETGNALASLERSEIHPQSDASVTSVPLSSPTGLPTIQRVLEDVGANAALHHSTALRQTSSRLSNQSLHRATFVGSSFPNPSNHSLSAPQNPSGLYGAGSLNRTGHFRSGSAASSQCSFRTFSPPAHVDWVLRSALQTRTLISACVDPLTGLGCLQKVHRWWQACLEGGSPSSPFPKPALPEVTE